MALAVNSEMSAGAGFSAANTSPLTSPQTFSFTNTAGSLLYAFVILGVNAGATSSYGTVTYNSVTMTNVLEQTSPTGESRAAWFRLLNPATGANTLSISFTEATSANYAVIAGCISFTGNDTVAPEVQSAGANGHDASPTYSLSGVASGNITIAGSGAGSDFTALTQTNSWLKNVNNFSQGGNGRVSRSASTGAVTHGFTISGVDSWFGGIIEVAAAGGAAPTVPVLTTPPFRRRRMPW